MNPAEFLESLPPAGDDGDTQGLWIGAESDVIAAAEQAWAGADRILAVVGPGRSGKSHLFSLIVGRMARQQPDRGGLLVRPALSPRNKVDAVLREILHQCFAAFRLHRAIAGALPPLDALLRALAHPISGAPADAAPEEIDPHFKFLEQILDAPTVAGWRDALRKSISEVSHGDQPLRRLLPLSEHALTGLVGAIHLCARRKDPGWTTYLILDDFDLLVRRDGKTLTPEPLLEALFRLTQLSGFAVLTTVRQDTHEKRVSAFQVIARAGKLSDADLLAMYQRRVERFHESHDPFPDGFVAGAARDCDGRPGLLLEFLEQTLQRAGDRLHDLRYPDCVHARWQELEPRLRALSHWPRLDDALGRHSQMTGLSAGDRLDDPATMEILYEEESSTDRTWLHPIFAAALSIRASLPPPCPQSFERAAEPSHVAGSSHAAGSPYVATPPDFLPEEEQTLPPSLRGLSAHALREAVDLYEVTLERAVKTEDRPAEARARAALGRLYLEEREFEQAAAHLQQALSMRQMLGDQAGIAEVRCAQGELALAQGPDQRQAGEAYLNEARRMFQALSDTHGEARALLGLGRAATASGNAKRATELGRQAAVLALTTGDHAGALEGFLLAGMGLLSQGLAGAAHKLLKEAEREAREAGGADGIRRVEELIARLA